MSSRKTEVDTGLYGLYFVASGRDLDGATLDTTVVDSNGYLAYRALLVVLALGIYAFWVWSFRRAAGAAAPVTDP